MKIIPHNMHGFHTIYLQYLYLQIGKQTKTKVSLLQHDYRDGPAAGQTAEKWNDSPTA